MRFSWADQRSHPFWQLPHCMDIEFNLILKRFFQVDISFQNVLRFVSCSYGEHAQPSCFPFFSFPPPGTPFTPLQSSPLLIVGSHILFTPTLFQAQDNLCKIKHSIVYSSFSFSTGCSAFMSEIIPFSTEGSSSATPL